MNVNLVLVIYDVGFVGPGFGVVTNQRVFQMADHIETNMKNYPDCKSPTKVPYLRP